MAKYTQEEEKELNKELKKWQNRAKRLILSDYYDAVAEDLSENTIGILTKLTNAESYKDINPYLWNAGIIDMTLDNISKRIQKAKKST